MFLNSKFYYFLFKCWILLKPVLGGVDGNLHFPIPSMNRLNLIEPATFSILPCWAFFRDSVFINLTLEVGIWLMSMTHRFILTNICAKLFEIPLINNKVLDRTQKCDGQTGGQTYFYILLFSSKRLGDKFMYWVKNDQYFWRKKRHSGY
jgi:hypothetical protein